MNEVNLIFPHQLFEQHPIGENGLPVYLIEEYLFFRQFAFHQQKIAYHRASMKSFEDHLKCKGVEVIYIESGDPLSDIRKLMAELAIQGVRKVHYVDTIDNWLEKRLKASAKDGNIELEQYTSPMFLNGREDLAKFFQPTKKKFFQTDFYMKQRKKLNILIDVEDKPLGGKWSFDVENRKKYPKNKTAPSIEYPSKDKYYEEALKYVENNFQKNPGILAKTPLYPTNYSSTKIWLNQFLEQRFLEFGDYEDAIVAENSILHHSVLTPMLNIGLITPKQVIDTALECAREHDIPINSTEGFIRQVIGWREFIRGIYEAKGIEERTRNYWGFSRKIPDSFYDGTTGVPPIDITIKKLLQTGYCHHIERLMVLGNFMLLCEFDPDEVYRWFMELFIDAYDWVMVPNIYGMSQFADGGMMATKPYISGSNYLMKMSNYQKGNWQDIWDGLFWRFMHVHRDFFTSNPRLGMLVGTFDRMSEEKKNRLLETANLYLESLK